MRNSRLVSLDRLIKTMCATAAETMTNDKETAGGLAVHIVEC